MSIYFYGCVTLDGYLADRNHGLGWLHETGTSEETGYNDFYKSLDITVMGRKTFREIERMRVADVYPTTQNYVFTHAQSLSQEGFIPVSGDPAEFVRRIDPEKNVWIVGGNSILAPMLDSDLIDILIIQIAPVLLGAGIPLFTQKEALKRFTLMDVKRYGQFAQLEYHRISH